MRTRLDANWISDHVPTYSDEVTRADLRVLRALAMTTEESAASDEGGVRRGDPRAVHRPRRHRLARTLFAGHGSDEQPQQELSMRVILDVRTPEEFAEGHVPNAKNIPVHELAHRLHEVGAKEQTVVVYCRSGGRSAAAATLLKRAGYAAVEDIGPISNWRG